MKPSTPQVKRRSGAPSETSAIVKPLVDAINGLPGCWATRLQSGLIRLPGRAIKLCEEGTPDLFALVKGTPVFIEAKKVGAKAREHEPQQAKVQERLRACGALVHVVTSYHEGMAVIRDLLEFERHRRRFAG
jgi:hypothetical protein